MRNGTASSNILTFRRSLKICLAIILCYYILLLGVIELTHHHDEHCHSHAKPCQSKDTCIACFFHSQHVSAEIESSALLIYPFLFSTTLPFYETVFLPLKLTTNTRSRAPPNILQ